MHTRPVHWLLHQLKQAGAMQAHSQPGCTPVLYTDAPAGTLSLCDAVTPSFRPFATPRDTGLCGPQTCVPQMCPTQRLARRHSAALLPRTDSARSSVRTAWGAMTLHQSNNHQLTQLNSHSELAPLALARRWEADDDDCRQSDTEFASLHRVVCLSIVQIHCCGAWGLCQRHCHLLGQ
jgi:hypothetical protein